MASAPKPYRRIAQPFFSPGALFGSQAGLWLGADHLLILRAVGFREEYQRIDLRDVKGFFILNSDRREIWTCAFGVFAFFSAVVLAIDLADGTHPRASAVILGLSLILLVWNHLLGRTCRVFLVSRVQTVRLRAMRRRRAANRALARLRSLIEAAQAGAAPPPPISAEAPPPLP